MNGFQLSQVERCAECEDLLNDWERSFIQSLLDLPPDAELTDKQMHKLNQIDTKVCQRS